MLYFVIGSDIVDVTLKLFCVYCQVEQMSKYIGIVETGCYSERRERYMEKRIMRKNPTMFH